MPRATIEDSKEVQLVQGSAQNLFNAVDLAVSSQLGAVPSKWLIDPRHSKLVTYWDATVGLALLYTAIVTPVEVGFLASFTAPITYRCK